MVAHKYNVLPIQQIDLIPKMVNEGVQTLKFLSSENEKEKLKHTCARNSFCMVELTSISNGTASELS